MNFCATCSFRYFFFFNVFIFAKHYLPAAKSDGESSSSSEKGEDELLVRPEMFSMTEANLCAILIAQYFLCDQRKELLSASPSTNIFGDDPPKNNFIDDETVKEFECRRKEFLSAKDVFNFCIQKANEGIYIHFEK